MHHEAVLQVQYVAVEAEVQLSLHVEAARGQPSGYQLEDEECVELPVRNKKQKMSFLLSALQEFQITPKHLKC